MHARGPPAVFSTPTLQISVPYPYSEVRVRLNPVLDYVTELAKEKRSARPFLRVARHYSECSFARSFGLWASEHFYKNPLGYALWHQQEEKAVGCLVLAVSPGVSQSWHILILIPDLSNAFCEPKKEFPLVDQHQ